MFTRDIPHLTGLRAVAALLVLSMHFDQIYGNALARSLSLVDQGYLGVDMFFVLSGFILSHVYGMDMTPGTYGAFLWRRFARLYPIHLATLAALLAMVAGRGLLDTNFWQLADLPRHLLLAQAWTNELTWNLPAWSISAEWAAYVAFPFFVAVVHRPRSPLVPAAFLAVLLLWFQLVGLGPVGIARSFMGWPAVARIAVEFGLGVLGHRWARGTAPSARYDWLALAAFAAVFAAPLAALKVLAVAIFVPMVSCSAGVVRAILSARMAVYLGTISYSIYMIHFPVLKVAQNFNAWAQLENASPTVGIAMLALWAVLIVGLAAGLYHTIEAPARNWCRRREAMIFGKLVMPPV